MHIPDGILPVEVAAAGYITAGALNWAALRKINQEPDPYAVLPRAALMSAAFFAASWIHIPIPPTSAHLVLNGLMGVLLGYYALPAITIGLFFQAVMFQHGGVTTLGVNTTIMGLPALLAVYVFQLRGGTGQTRTLFFAFLGGALGIGAGALLAFILLITTIPGDLDVEAERAAIITLTLAHIPLMLIEGTFTAFVVRYLTAVKPEMLVRRGLSDT